MSQDAPHRLGAAKLVGGGMAEWTEPGRDELDRYVPFLFVDATEQEELLALVDRYQEDPQAWRCEASWEEHWSRLASRVASPPLAFSVSLAGKEMAPLRSSLLAARRLYVCPTTVHLGLSARLAHDRHFPARILREEG